MTLQVELVSPERIAYSGEATMVVARTTAGDIAFMDGHIPFIGVLATWPVKVFLTDGSVQVIAVHQGFVEVSPRDAEGNSRVTILSDVCELAEQIDVARAQAAKERAAAVNAAPGTPEATEAAAALARADVRLTVASGARAATAH